MNKDILKGKWLEIMGRVKETWGKVTDNNFYEIEGKGEKLFGLLRKRYGYIRDKADLEYKDSIEWAEVVSRIREIRTEKTDIMAIAFIARYGRPLLNKSQENQIAGKDEKHGYYIDRYSYTRLSQHNTYLASR
jgi:uncharacterized protein YjbJ (UPF0337 family)